jgi:hypothetical protein
LFLFGFTSRKKKDRAQTGDPCGGKRHGTRFCAKVGPAVSKFE